MKKLPLLASANRIALVTLVFLVHQVGFAAPITLSSLWIDPDSGGQVIVNSTASDNVFTYDVKNVSYNPPGGDGFYGITGFNPRLLNYSFVPQFVSVTSPPGWPSPPPSPLPIGTFPAWGRGSVGFAVSPYDPNKPLPGLFPGDSALFSFTVTGGEAVIQKGAVYSSTHFANGSGCVGCYSVVGDLLYPGPPNIYTNGPVAGCINDSALSGCFSGPGDIYQPNATVTLGSGTHPTTNDPKLTVNSNGIGQNIGPTLTIKKLDVLRGAVSVSGAGILNTGSTNLKGGFDNTPQSTVSFTQTGGTHTIKTSLSISSMGAPNPLALYNLLGGQLNIGDQSNIGSITMRGTNSYFQHQNGGTLKISGGDRFVNVIQGNFLKSGGITEFHLNKTVSTSLSALYANANPDTLIDTKPGNSTAQLSGNIAVFRDNNTPSSKAGDYASLINAGNINLGITSHITSSPTSQLNSNTNTTQDAMAVRLGNVNFTAPSFTTSDPNAPKGQGYMMPVQLTLGNSTAVTNNNFNSLGLLNVYQASNSNPSAIFPSLTKYTTINQAQSFITTSQVAIASLLSNDVYSNALSSNPTTSNYSVLSSLSLGGFFANAYQGKGSAAGNIIISVRGSDNFQNGLADIGFSGITNPVLSQYVNNLSSFVSAIYAANTGNTITLTGHSLGGGLAEFVGQRMGVDAIAFNAPGIGNIQSLYKQETNVINGIGSTPQDAHYNLMNVTLKGDVVSGLPLSKVGQEITLQNDPITNYFKGINADPVLKNQLSKVSVLVNHSMDLVNFELTHDPSALTLSFDGKLVAIGDSVAAKYYAGYLSAKDFFLTPIKKTLAAGTSFLNGQVIKGLGYIAGADPAVVNGFSFNVTGNSPNFRKVGLPDLGDPTIQYQIEEQINGVWTVVGTANPSTIFDFGESGVNFFKIVSTKQLALIGQDSNVYFELTFNGDGAIVGSITPLDALGIPIAAVPEPDTYVMLIAGLGLMGFLARRKQA